VTHDVLSGLNDALLLLGQVLASSKTVTLAAKVLLQKDTASDRTISSLWCVLPPPPPPLVTQLTRAPGRGS
jgi:hypothetical protein